MAGRQELLTRRCHKRTSDGFAHEAPEWFPEGFHDREAHSVSLFEPRQACRLLFVAICWGRISNEKSISYFKLSFAIQLKLNPTRSRLVDHSNFMKFF